ncbi:cytochrome P450 family protein [Rhizoctonia solani]|uniref:Cytochrome P450 family protein n=1 Tax=Rhizoctonia solani TaxID=456999 RepID=A0A8H8P1Q6_9AGAM|nr:cytochrome P450 family protein [Rhizoctonia solani]QRW23620.1 cytochrome P450 family protein [Rhizoctonia solani]
MADVEKLLAGSLGALALVWLCHRTLHQQLPLPPGPSGHWIWGNVAEMNVPHRPVKAATDWKEQYGDIICLRTLSNTTVIINSEALATELLEKRAAETSDRPRNVFVRELMGWNTSTVLHTHNNRHRQLRKTMALVLQQSQARTYSTLHSSNLLQFLRALAKTPDNYMNHIDDSASRFIMNLAYGHEIIEDDPLVAAVRAGQIYMEDGLATHRWVNSLPFLRYYPAWAPGGEFQKVAREGLRRRLEYANVPFDTVMDGIRRNQLVQPSFTSRLLEQKGGANASEEDVDLIKWSAASLFGGGTATTVSILATLIFCLVIHPEITKKAQDEIDRVIGPNRLPTVHDRGSLPYVEAVLQEVMRYYPVVPLCIPHSTEQDIEFQGYRIPKGSSIEPNLWAILHDPDIYSDPHVFRPERYLESKPAPDPRKYIFGFGRRICPGIHIAYDSTFINCAGLISVFDFRASAELLASVDAAGGRESPDMWKLFNSSKIVRPKPFRCSIQLRNDAAKRLLKTSVTY